MHIYVLENWLVTPYPASIHVNFCAAYACISILARKFSAACARACLFYVYQASAQPPKIRGIQLNRPFVSSHCNPYLMRLASKTSFLCRAKGVLENLFAIIGLKELQYDVAVDALSEQGDH